MKKILEKDKKNRYKINFFEKKKTILKNISYNSTFLNLTCWEAAKKLNELPIKSSKTFITNRCVKTIKKKKFNKLTTFSRMCFLKLVRSQQITNIHKASW